MVLFIESVKNGTSKITRKKYLILIFSLVLSSLILSSALLSSTLFCSVLLFSALLSPLLFYYYGITHTDETVDSSDSAQQSSSSQSVPGSGPGSEQNNIGFIIPKKRTEEPTAIPILSTYCTALNVLYFTSQCCIVLYCIV